ncbi:hypothetical protein CMUS01_04469 [Colletotrichum musicola]|uniref:Chitin-binding type-1 domain-containing protein n=1 Tax=Colletotrichum musicola TaxID=2175873 RepID=A0A8H6NN31_9PEZI|nr:hypothetical protein CMUS01_04469 [Colletotrichum musicola]
MRLTTNLLVGAHLLALLTPGRAANDCQPHTWSEPGLMQTVAARERPEVTPSPHRKRATVSTGDVVCRAYGETGQDVNYYTCMEMAKFWWIDVDFFFTLNPTLNKDCGNIQPNTEYCTDGWIEPKRDPDGRCGPQFGNASCAYGNLPCCNSETWKCGETYDDCAAGTCFEGLCPGDAVYSTDGTCGIEHGNRQCAGKWGDCCSRNGRCGTGPDYCGPDTCQMGNCTVSHVPGPTSSLPFTLPPGDSTAKPTSAAESTSSTAASTTTTTAASPACTAGSNAPGISDNLKGLCSYSCDFNHCPAGACVCTGPAAKPADIPELTGRHGCPDDTVTDDMGYYADLCEFTCSHGYCPPGACRYC